MRNRKNLGAGEETTDINISPLIDMVFILLIFFIVTTVFVEEAGLEGNTPDPIPSTEPPDEDKERVSFLVRRNGQVIYDGRDVGVAAVTGIVAPEMRNEEYPITVEVEPQARMALVVAVIDAAKSGGAPQVTMKAVAE